MTAGVRTSDNRSLTSTSCGNALIGEYFYREWSGSDWLPGVPDRTQDHDYQLTVVKRFDPLIRWNFSGGSGLPFTGSISSCFGGPSVLLVPWDSNDELKLLGKLSDKIRKNDFNGDAFIAEGHQTIRLLASTAHRLGGFLENIRHGNLYKAARYLGGPKVSNGRSKILSALKRELTPNGKSTGSLQNAILEVQYGWRPLLKDAHEFGTALAAIYNKVPYQVYRVRRKVIVSDVEHGPINYNRRSTKTVWLKVTVSSEPATRQILHMNDPLAAAWEFTPWSFIADWFIPIGSWLAGVNAVQELGIVKVLRSEKITSDGLVLDGGDNYIISNYQDYRSSTVDFVRGQMPLENYGDVPLPSWKPVSKVFGPEHALNAFALLTSKSNGFKSALKF